MQTQFSFWIETRERTDGVMELVIRQMPQDGGNVERPQDDENAVKLQNGEAVKGTELSARLSFGEDVCLKARHKLSAGESWQVPCPEVKRWDPEHPVLYTLQLQVFCQGEVIWECGYRIGFRSLEKAGRQLLWNHIPLKLKGICYRERLGDPDGTRKDLELFAAANINFIRGMYYPFSEEFIGLCDEMGFLVENTAPFYEVGQLRKSEQDLPHCRAKFVQPVRGMLKTAGSHVSVLIWSLGHDCAWGHNFRLAADAIRAVDGIRPLIFHLPMSIPEEEPQMDVWPVHYIDWRQPFDVCFDQMVIFHTPGDENEIGYKTGQAEYPVPVLHEIWSPVPCHNRTEINADWSVREFWGESIRRFAEKSRMTEGCLGGAVLAGVDEDGSFEGMAHYEWGILDCNHCPKPEYRHLAEAYSPVKVSAEWRERNGDEILFLQVENRFLFTDLKECALQIDGTPLDIGWSGEPGSSREYEITGLVLETARAQMARERGRNPLEAAGTAQRTNRTEIRIYRKGSCICTERVSSNIRVAEPEKEDKRPGLLGKVGKTCQIRWEENGDLRVVSGKLCCTFDGRSGLLIDGAVEGRSVLKGGPWLNTTGLRKGEWIGTGLSAVPIKEGVQVTIEGSYGSDMDVRFDLLLMSDGVLHTSYEVRKLNRHMPHRVKAEIGLSGIGLNERGISYLLTGEVNRFLGEQDGERRLLDPYKQHWGSFYQVKDFTALNAEGGGLQLTGAAAASIRLESVPVEPAGTRVNDRDERMHFQGSWMRISDACGNYKDTETASRTAGDTMTLTFTGTGVELYGSLDMNGGLCRVELDGRILADEISQYPENVDFPGMSRGYEKQYGRCLFHTGDLVETSHTLKVTVLGRSVPEAQNTYTSIDYAELRGRQHPRTTLLHVNQTFNFTRLVRGCYKNPDVYLVEGVREGFAMRLF